MAAAGVVSRAAMARPSLIARARTGRALLLSATLVDCLLLRSIAAHAGSPVVDSEKVMREHPVDPAKGASLTEVLRGAQASVNVWQITGTLPPHLHRAHEEVIIVRSGHARARIGDQDVELGPGDVFLVPKGTIHAARAIGEEPFVGVSVFAPAFDGSDRVPVPEPTP